MVLVQLSQAARSRLFIPQALPSANPTLPRNLWRPADQAIAVFAEIVRSPDFTGTPPVSKLSSPDKNSWGLDSSASGLRK